MYTLKKYVTLSGTCSWAMYMSRRPASTDPPTPKLSYGSTVATLKIPINLGGRLRAATVATRYSTNRRQLRNLSAILRSLLNIFTLSTPTAPALTSPSLYSPTLLPPFSTSSNTCQSTLPTLVPPCRPIEALHHCGAFLALDLKPEILPQPTAWASHMDVHTAGRGAC